MDKATFKEELTLEAEMNALKTDVSEDIEHIKQKMKKCVDCRSYTVSLIKAHSNNIAIGGIPT